MDLSEKLIQLGFTKNQAAVYSALIELGQSKAGDIIKKTRLHRNIVYEALEDLVKRKLAFKTSQGGVSLFQLSDATTLVHDAESRMSLAQDISAEINSLRTKSTHEIKLYEGKSGMASHRQAILQDITAKDTEKSAEVLVLGASVKVVEDFNDLLQKYHEKRSDAEVDARMLFSPASRKFASQREALPSTEVKFLPQTFKNPTTIDIWKDNVAFTLYDIEPFIVSIKNESLANSFREYFDNIWSQDTFVTNGLKEVQQLFFTKLHELKKGEEYVVLGANYGETTKDKLTAWFKDYHTERIKNGVKVKLLGYIDDQETLKHEMIAGGDPDMKVSQLRYFGPEFDSPMQINIYPNSIILVHWAEDAVAVEIRRPDIRNAMLLYFNALWKTAKK